jgi:hypothetical protein
VIRSYIVFINLNYVNQKIWIVNLIVSKVTLVLFANHVMFLGQYGKADLEKLVT